jgi:hypothetical protein
MVATGMVRNYFNMMADDLENVAQVDRAFATLVQAETMPPNRGGSLIVRNSAVAEEAEDVATAYRFVARGGTRALLCSGIRLSEMRDVANQEDKESDAESRMDRYTRPNISPAEFVKMMAYALRADISSCEAAARAEEQNERALEQRACANHCRIP